MPGHAPGRWRATRSWPVPTGRQDPKHAETYSSYRCVFCAGNKKTFTFLEDVLTEVMGLFPSPWIHIGGDECSKDHWRTCPLCQARIKAEGLENERGAAKLLRQADRKVPHRQRAAAGRLDGDRRGRPGAGSHGAVVAR